MNLRTLSCWLAVVVCATCTGVAGGVGAVVEDLPPPEKPSKILMLLPISSRSDVEVFVSYAEALAYRGHRIVMLLNQKPERKNFNVFQLSHGLDHFRHDQLDAFESPDGVLDLVSRDKLVSFTREFYQLDEVKALYEMRKKFDLIVVHQMLSEVVYPFLHEVPFIFLSTAGLDSQQSATLGNVLNPAFEIEPLLQPLDALKRFQSTFAHCFRLWYRKYWTVVPAVQREISALFPELPPLLDLERNQSLVLVNSHFSLGPPLPLLPSQVEVGGIHCRPGQPLPEDLDTWISGAGEAGVIYLSLGSNGQPFSMPSQYRQVLTQALGKLDQKVIWRYMGEVDNASDNVLVRQWLPQQDILAHPNVKAFINLGDFLSIQEAVCHSKPVLALPISTQQTKNAATVRNSGLGLELEWEDLTEEILLRALREIVENPKFQEAASEISSALRDQLRTPLDLAVFWTEYVIRQEGAPRLRSPAVDLSWVEFLMLDVLAALHVVLLLFFVMLRRLARFISRLVCGSEKQKTE
ncbi:UDP-glycosyltransferase UGT5-like [Penaeus indicus]|uniref:UDP-glycosyltransferase UGT5-like n=1 Tax=Penaeus indicus TaxID=29960 RepID=UPI00300CD804